MRGSRPQRRREGGGPCGFSTGRGGGGAAPVVDGARAADGNRARPRPTAGGDGRAGACGTPRPRRNRPRKEASGGEEPRGLAYQGLVKLLIMAVIKTQRVLITSIINSSPLSIASSYLFTVAAVGGAFSVAQRPVRAWPSAAGDFPGRGLARSATAGQVGVGGWNAAPPPQARQGGKAGPMPRIWRHGPRPPRPQTAGLTCKRPWGWLFGGRARPCAVVVRRGTRSGPHWAAG